MEGRGKVKVSSGSVNGGKRDRQATNCGNISDSDRSGDSRAIAMVVTEVIVVLGWSTRA